MMPEVDPELLIQACECGRPDCDRFVIAIIHPVIKPLESDPSELVAMCYVPKKYISAMKRRLEEER
jgi:hypothetical protein